MYCPNCNGDSGPHACCHACRKYLPRTAAGVRASLAPRVVAFLVDTLLLVFFIAAALWASRFVKQDGPIPTHMVAVVAAASLLYLTAFIQGLYSGQTLGKLAFKLKVVDTWSGQVPRIRKMLLRETPGKLLSALAFGLGYLSALRDPDRRTWHDKLAGTIVLARNPQPAAPSAAPTEQPLWPVAFLAAFLLLFVSALLAPTLQHPVQEAKSEAPTTPPQRAASLPVGFALPIRSGAPAPKPSAMEFAEFTSASIPATPRAVERPLHAPAPTPARISPIAPARPTPTPAPSPVPTPAPIIDRTQYVVTPAPEPAVTQADPAQEIEHFLANWSSAEADQGAQQVGNFYAPDVQRYFLRRNVSRSYVVADHQAYLDRGRRALFFKITDIRFERLSENSASLDALKSWNEISPDGTSATRRSTRSRLWLEKFADGWKIIGEQDLKTP